jgi:hypothetical protein
MRRVRYITGTCAMAIALSGVALVQAYAQDLRPVNFSGTIHD